MFIIEYKIDLINVLSKLKILVYIYKLIFVLLEYLSKWKLWIYVVFFFMVFLIDKLFDFFSLFW